MNNIAANWNSILLTLTLAFYSIFSHSQTDNDSLLSQGTEYYEAKEYKLAKETFEKLTELEPENSNYYHWLGKSYGRIAENAPWLTAMSMAKKTRKSFEKAIELDSANIPALADLKQYYLDAPGFLGGSKKKAEEIDKILQKLSK